MKGKIALEDHFAVATISEADRERVGSTNARRLFKLN
jgi:predicted TIM-barrel fold metal-dependent hydrolase